MLERGSGKMGKTAILGLLILAFVVSGCASLGGPYIPSPYGSYNGANNLPRRAPHAGVDFVADYSSPVIAAADGRVSITARRTVGCGYSVFIEHDKFFNLYTVYCHLSDILVKPDDAVKRGQVIGLVGTTGNAFNVPHVHLELCTASCPYGHADGSLWGTKDPLENSDGCFDPKKQYPTDRLVLTYPVKC